jgi:hypothetical protein
LMGASLAHTSETRLRSSGAFPLSRFPAYRGGASSSYGSCADIGLAEPGIQGDRCSTRPKPQSARSEVGWAANAAQNAKAAAAATVTLRRYMPLLPDYALCGGRTGGISNADACGGRTGGMSNAAACGGRTGGMSNADACGGRTGGISNADACGGRTGGMSNAAACGGRTGGMSNADACGGRTGGISNADACGGRTGGISNAATCGGRTGGMSSTAACGGRTGGISKAPKAELATAQPATKATRLTFIMNAPI